MKKIAIFGGTGGIGQKLGVLLSKSSEVLSLGSKDVDITCLTEVENFFSKNDIDVVLLLSVFNFDNPVHKYSEDNHNHLKRQIDVNILGAINVSSTFLKNKRKQNKSGDLIFFSSVLSDNPLFGTSIYSASKSFIETFTKSCSKENSPKGIKTNCIQLGYFNAGLFEKVPENVKEDVLKSIPMSKWGEISDIEKTVNFIINNDYLTGQVIKINGGL